MSDPKATAAALAAEQGRTDNPMYRMLWRLHVLKKSVDVPKTAWRETGFWGDRPTMPETDRIVDEGSDGPLPRYTARAPDFSSPVPARTEHNNVYYTPNGFGWTGRQLDQSLSVMLPRTLGRVWAERPRSTSRRIAEGTIVQCEHPYTYGDWVIEHLTAIARGGDFPQPLVLPLWIGARGYPGKILDRLGIDYTIAEEPVLIEKATVLHKPHPAALLTRDVVEAHRALFGVTPETPAPGRLVYLSRAGIASEQVKIERENYSDLMGRVVEDMGGTVVATSAAGLDDYLALSRQADIVVADHGAAMMNVMFWRPRVMIELIDDSRWDTCFAFLSQACGIGYHGVIKGSGLDPDGLRAKLTAHIELAQSSDNH